MRHPTINKHHPFSRRELANSGMGEAMAAFVLLASDTSPSQILELCLTFEKKARSNARAAHACEDQNHGRSPLGA